MGITNRHTSATIAQTAARADDRSVVRPREIFVPLLFAEAFLVVGLFGMWTAMVPAMLIVQAFALGLFCFAFSLFQKLTYEEPTGDRPKRQKNSQRVERDG